jgi:hypothetical protein
MHDPAGNQFQSHPAIQDDEETRNNQGPRYFGGEQLQTEKAHQLDSSQEIYLGPPAFSQACTAQAKSA